MLKLKTKQGHIWFNPAHIAAFGQNKDGKTWLSLIGEAGDETPWTVEDAPEEIVAMMNTFNKQNR